MQIQNEAQNHNFFVVRKTFIDSSETFRIETSLQLALSLRFRNPNGQTSVTVLKSSSVLFLIKSLVFLQKPTSYR